METVYQILKTVLVLAFFVEQLFAPKIAGGDFPPSGPAEPGDETKYARIEAPDEGFDTFRPVDFEGNGGYRYGPSMILNADGSVDAWYASNGPGDYIDIVNYKRWSPDFKKSTPEVTALTPTAGTYDCDRVPSACDPGVIKFGGWYYIGYSTSWTCVARSRSPEGPFLEKWAGDGWSTDACAPIITYDGTPGYFGSAEPSFVVLGDTLYIFYTWWDEYGPATRVATADATDENWPATMVHHGECIPPKDDGDSADVVYSDEYGRFIAVFTEKRFSDNSYVAVWESFDGLTFRRAGFVKDNTCKKLHNCGISARADGHIGKGDPVYLSYAYGGADADSWGNWATRTHKVTLSLADEPMEDLSLLTHSDVSVSRRKAGVLPRILTVKAERLSYTISESERIWIMAFDADGICYPVLTGVRFDGYDKSVIKMIGSRVIPVAPGETRVWVHWGGFTSSFVVHVT